jgi:hypothetical protein
MESRSLRARVLAVSAALALGACFERATPIKEILDKPADYDGKRVTVEGEVSDSANILVLKFYRLQDATGRIAVVTSRAVPRPGAHVRSTGTVHQAFALGSDQLTVIVENAE